MVEKKGREQKVSEAAVIREPGSSTENRTGSWRTFRPVITDKCSGCSICTWYCPENCIKIINKKACVDYNYCTGCGICAGECPAKAIEMREEKDSGGTCVKSKKEGESS